MEQVLNLIDTRISAARATGNVTEEIFTRTIKNEIERIIHQRDAYESALESALQTNDALLKKTDLPSADEYRNSIGAQYYYQREWSEPKYICPKCGGGMCKHENIVFCSNPPQYEYECNKCGHVEYQLG